MYVYTVDDTWIEEEKKEMGNEWMALKKNTCIDAHTFNISRLAKAHGNDACCVLQWVFLEL